MAQTAFPITTFVLPNGSPVALGWITLHLNKDCQYTATSGAGQVGSRIKIKVNLDSNGDIEGAPVFWPNSELLPNDSVYIMSVYRADGQRVLGPVDVTVGPTAGALGFGVAFGSSFGS